MGVFSEVDLNKDVPNTIDTLAKLIQMRAGKTPDGIAFLGLQQRMMSFSELAQQMDAVKRSLNQMGVGCGERVAIVLPNGPELAAAFLTIAACSTSAPLNPAYSMSEFDFYLGDLDAKALVIQAETASPARLVAESRKIPVVELVPNSNPGRINFELQSDSAVSADNTGFANPADIALVLHTSGTTSRPKMVPLSQANIIASASHIVQTLTLTPADRCLNVMPLFHIHGLMAVVLSSLMAGASVACTPGFQADQFFPWIEEFHPSWYSAVPTMHQSVLAAAKSYFQVILANPLRLIRSSSASLPPKMMADLEQVFKAPVIEAYGMTEAAHQMASNPLPPRVRKPGSVGLPAGPEIAILDEGEKFVNPNQVGEIVIRGRNVMSGYANNPEASQAAFFNGWFRTGDEGYLDADGYLFITGRIKEMINRGGEKVAPREVDEVFLDHPEVAQAVTFAIPHPTLGEDVATAVVIRTGSLISEKELRDYALDRLAAQKAPSLVIILDSIPKGPTGKLQRIGLAEKLKSHLNPPYQAPRTQTEQALVNLWKQVLHSEWIGIFDNFFASGGDSLLATRLIRAHPIGISVGNTFGNDL